MSGKPSAEACLEPAELEVDLVVNDEQVLEGGLVERRRRLHRAARVVHVRVRLEEGRACVADPDLGDWPLNLLLNVPRDDVRPRRRP